MHFSQIIQNVVIYALLRNFFLQEKMLRGNLQTFGTLADTHLLSVSGDTCSTTAVCSLSTCLLTILKKTKQLQKFYCYSLTNQRLIMWTRTNDQSVSCNTALLYKHKGQEISLILYGQTSTYRRFDSAYRRRPKNQHSTL